MLFIVRNGRRRTATFRSPSRISRSSRSGSRGPCQFGSGCCWCSRRMGHHISRQEGEGSWIILRFLSTHLVTKLQLAATDLQSTMSSVLETSGRPTAERTSSAPQSSMNGLSGDGLDREKGSPMPLRLGPSRMHLRDPGSLLTAGLPSSYVCSY